MLKHNGFTQNRDLALVWLWLADYVVALFVSESGYYTIYRHYWASCAHYQLKKTQINHSWGTRPCLDILFHFSFAGNVLAWSFCCILFDSHLSKWHLHTNILICNVCMYYVSKLIQSYLMKELESGICIWQQFDTYVTYDICIYFYNISLPPC